MTMRRLLVLVKSLPWVKVHKPADRGAGVSALARLVGMGTPRTGRKGRAKGDIIYTPKRR